MVFIYGKKYHSGMGSGYVVNQSCKECGRSGLEIVTVVEQNTLYYIPIRSADQGYGLQCTNCGQMYKISPQAQAEVVTLAYDQLPIYNRAQREAKLRKRWEERERKRRKEQEQLAQTARYYTSDEKTFREMVGSLLAAAAIFMMLSAYFFWNWLHYIFLLMLPFGVISRLLEKPASPQLTKKGGLVLVVGIAIISVIAEMFHFVWDLDVTPDPLFFGMINLITGAVYLFNELGKIDKASEGSYQVVA